jgi:hypothetical protein
MQRMKTRLSGRYIPKDALCTMSHGDRNVRIDGNYFAYRYGKIGVEP